MRVLNYCGYIAEKNERAAVSSTHDTTHCTYGTACDGIITMDKRFARKCQAVYYYIGVTTKVLYCDKPDSFLIDIQALGSGVRKNREKNNVSSEQE